MLSITVAALTIALQSSPFPDVPANHWASPAVQNLKDAGILRGYPNGNFNDPHDRTPIKARISGFLNQTAAEGLWFRPTTLTGQRSPGSRYEAAVVVRMLLDNWSKLLAQEPPDGSLRKLLGHTGNFKFWIKELRQEFLDLDDNLEVLLVKLQDLHDRTKARIGK
ncbi:MAG: S-layer homology domain-containing protein [Fimbriimonadaceae bacterium]|nr:S-layer homology domain-containing protein [Fimbriimonadaceae bacterium]